MRPPDGGTLNGRVAMVTGGGAGIGRAVVGQFVEAGAHVVAVDIDGDSLDQLARVHGTSVTTQRVDVADPDAVLEAVEAAVADVGGVDHLVNNAGIIGRRMTVADLDPAELERVLRVNIASAFHVTRAVVRHPSGRTGRTIVNMGSTAATSGGMPGTVVYATTKGAIASFTVALAKELAPHVRVNAVAPGVIDTAIQTDVVGDLAELSAVVEQTPLRRLGEPAEVAEAVLWLSSPASSYVTGTTLHVSGGR